MKLIADWLPSGQLCELWNRQSQGDFDWDDIEVTSDDDDIDYYVIVNRPADEREQFRRDRTIVFQMEPSGIRRRGSLGVARSPPVPPGPQP